MAMPASTRAGASSVRGSRRSARNPPIHAPYAIAANAMPMTELVTWRVTPTYGPTRRNETVSRTSTAPLERNTRTAASPFGRARGGVGAVGAVGADSTTTSDDELLTVAMLRSRPGTPGQYIER
ncbi:hypothetical protein GA0070613_2468 [Micromonospora inositola]|uniref:Uncharacterized protein n=1 Tax=Micromonospora inositola TaxID=47865 RepID=A0A1C5I9N3_9ACTN|nr:hypothetical protein GA0070613_2468 [Micromonospora inositola]